MIKEIKEKVEEKKTQGNDMIKEAKEKINSKIPDETIIKVETFKTKKIE